MIFRQLFDEDSSTFTYLLADPQTKEGILIDPVKEKFDRDLQIIKELGVKLKYTLETHVHADHITASSDFRKRTESQSVISENSGVTCADIYLADGDVLEFGQYKIKAFHTPGHTNGCMSYFIENMVFTGDTLLARGTGRTDFQSGSAEDLFSSIVNKLYSLPENTLVYPGHDYKGWTCSSIGEEKNFNPRVKAGTSKDEFVNIMSNLNMGLPKKIHEAVPANLVCGQEEER